jgi:hypothetical protein
LVAKANSKTEAADTIRKEVVAFFKRLNKDAFDPRISDIADMYCAIRKDDESKVV